MLRPAVEETLKEFEEREGVEVVTKYNGCGILVAEMKAGEQPDAYFACDKSFMDQVDDLFLDAEDVSTNQLVILVHKGNPHGIKTLDDLGKPGLRVGVGHEKQCALGVLTQKTLEQGGVKAEVMKNVKAQSPTGDMLVNRDAHRLARRGDRLRQQRDRARRRAGGHPHRRALRLAVQPMAVGQESKHKQLTQRLLAALRSAESRGASRRTASTGGGAAK